MYKYFWIVFVLFLSYRSYAVSCADVLSGGMLFEKNFVHSVDKEQNLLAQGFPQYYVNGLDEAVRLVELQQHWKAIKAHPETHILYFVEKISAHIAEIERGIRTSELSEFEKYSRLKTLRALKREADFVKRSYKVTSTWWNIFNIRLVALVTSPIESAFNLGLSQRQLEDYQTVYTRLQEKRDKFDVFNSPYIQMMERFPDVVLVPTVGEIGPTALNQVMSEHIHFIGVSGTYAEVDGKRLSPQDYFRHDGEHVYEIERFLDGIEETLTKQNPIFHNRFRMRIASLPTAERMQQEMLYFLLLRERGTLRANDSTILQRNFDRMMGFDHLVDLLPERIRSRWYTDKEEYMQLLQEYFEDTVRHYNAISQEVEELAP